jgi:hypothetical protein
MTEQNDTRDRRPGTELDDAEIGHATSREEKGLSRTKSGVLARRMSESRRKRVEEEKENSGKREVPVAVVEQRVSNLAQGALCQLNYHPSGTHEANLRLGLVLMTKPFEHVLGLIPKGVLAGLFWYMGTDALLTSGVTEKMLYLIRDRRATSPSDPLNRVRKSRIIIFTIVELLGFGATFAITQVCYLCRT